mmetsp:Transcript_44188/g.98978  ORF Transcript_44188/g.98978 Transcript_44188/m.98978 type:complete len:84 (+) Transcript_44188:78-329(+)
MTPGFSQRHHRPPQGQDAARAVGLASQRAGGSSWASPCFCSNAGGSCESDRADQRLKDVIMLQLHLRVHTAYPEEVQIPHHAR